MQYVLLAVVLAVFVIVLGQVSLMRRREAPLRRQIRIAGGQLPDDLERSEAGGTWHMAEMAIS
jgi:hypothetical protein